MTRTEPYLTRSSWRVVYDKTRSHIEISATATEAIAAALKNEEDLPKEALPVAPTDIVGERSAPVSDLSVPVGRAVPGWPGS